MKQQPADNQLPGVLALAWPAVVENLSATLVSFVDTAMVGSLGAGPTAAVAVNASPTWLLNGLMVALGVGATALVARLWGAGEQRSARQAGAQVLAVACALSFLFAVLAYALAPAIPRLMRASAGVHADATAYLRIVSLGFVPSFCGIAVSAMLRGAGDTRTPMRAGILANLLNVCGNYLLIYPARPVALGGLRFILPGAGLGVRGAAIATALAIAVSGLYLVSRLFALRHPLSLRGLGRFKPDWHVIRRVARVAAPAALERVSINAGQIVFAAMVSAIGTNALAAHHLAITIEGLGYMPGYGFAAAAAALVGLNLGAGAPQQAQHAGMRAIGLGTIIMTAMGVVMFFAAQGLISFFTPDPQVRQIGAMLIRICAFEQPFSAFSIIAPGALRGAGDTVAPFVVALASMWGVRIVLAWLLGFQLGWGVAGVWIAMVGDLAVRGILLLIRFMGGKWRLMKI